MYGETLDEWVDAAAAAEDAGMAAVWSQELHRTAFLPLAAAAPRTRGIALGTAVALAFTRSPLITALEALDVDELCGGRLILGLGSGVKRLVESWHGAPFEHPAQRLRETVAVIRAVIARAHLGEPIEERGDLLGITIRGWRRPLPPTRERVPVYLASVGPVMTRTAGEVGDGWIAHELGSPRYLRERILPRLEEGWTAAGRSREDFTIVASACCVPMHDGAAARRLAAHQVAFYASVATYQDFFAFHGFEAEAVRCQELLRAGRQEEMTDTVTDAMVDGLTAAGTPDEVRRRLAGYDGLADMIKLGPPTHAPERGAAEAAQRAILEVFAA